MSVTSDCLDGARQNLKECVEKKDFNGALMWTQVIRGILSPKES